MICLAGFAVSREMYTPWPGALGPFISPLPELMMHLSDSWETINHRINNLWKNSVCIAPHFLYFSLNFILVLSVLENLFSATSILFTHGNVFR